MQSVPETKIREKKIIAGVVILYNPDSNVIENINSYINQIDFLFIIDNSEKSNSFIKDFLLSYKKVEFINNNCNLGVAAGLNIGAKKAIEKGYSFLLTMDQDSAVPPNMVDDLYEGTKLFENVGIISPFHDNRFHTKTPLEKIYSNVLNVMTSGNLLNLSAFKDTGDFNEDFFIDYVDIEYCLRLNLKKYQVIQANKILLTHNEADITKRFFFLKTVYPSNHSPIRFYYKTRNRLYLRKSFKNFFRNFFRIERRMFWSTLIKALLYENDKILKLKMVLLGYRDYLNGKMGSFIADPPNK